MSLRTRLLEDPPMGYVALDLSDKKENFPVLFFNGVDSNHDPVSYEYLMSYVFPSFMYSTRSGVECDYAGGCSDSCLCSVRNGGEFAYNLNGILCGHNCRCPPICRNKVTQKGVRNRFEVFRSRETNWGVRSLDLIPAGSFICEYSGVVLTRE
ncbi:histone-lysine n-methyltransferase [Striga asiatica]|uniref:Histone-lysine n-methyltransferase n=1 Tax=Striga asiatica TaxID=4170 RepID=A0A5A7QTS2_STRAF|nr:histone-lysine n-methyltransferase [Striga asiatica]